MSSRTIISAIADSYTQGLPYGSVYPNKNMDTSTRDYIGGYIQSWIWWANPIPRGAQVVRAKFWFKAAPGGTSPWNAADSTVSVALIKSAWAANKITWNNQPLTVGATVNSTVPASPDPTNKWYSVDITSLMQAVSNGTPWYGINVKGSASGNTAWRGFYSMSAAAADRPYVEVEWSTKPSVPTVMAPSGGRLVSTKNPLLNFGFVPGPDKAALKSAWVQVATDANFSNVVFDTGWFNTDVPQVQVTGVNLDGAAYYWRAQVRDQNDQESGWSATNQFGYAAIGTVTIQSPDQTATDPSVGDTSPVVLWSTSFTQSQYRVQLMAPNSSVPMYDSGWVTSTDKFATIPSGFIVNTGIKYRVYVQVKDSQLRVDNAYGLSYAQSYVDFTYKRSTAVSPVSGLTIVQSDTSPVYYADVTRSSAPDSFVLIQDGVVIGNPMLPGEYVVSAGKYRLPMFPPGRRQVAVEVACVENGVTSSNNPVNNLNAYRKVPWICDEQGGNAVPLLNFGHDFETGEMSQIVEPVGAPPYLVTQWLGLERGTIEGELVTNEVIPGLSAREFRRRLKKIRSDNNGVCRLLFSDESWKVFISNFKFTRISNANKTTDYLFSCTAYQLEDAS